MGREDLAGTQKSEVVSVFLRKTGGKSMYIDHNLVKRMKETYLPGTRIELDMMGDDPRPIAPGTRGTVRIVDDIGTVHCDFDNGRHLGLVPGEDSFRRVED
jgi:hypothetical protein